MIQENNWVITTKKGAVKLLLFCGNGERVIPVYALNIGNILGSRLMYLLKLSTV